MKKVFKYLAILLSIMVLMLEYSNITAYAVSVSQDRIVVSHSGTWGNYPFNFSGSGNYYTIADPTGLTSISGGVTQYFYSSDGVTFDIVPASKLLTFLYNKVIGVVIDPDKLDNFYNNFWNATGVLDSTYNLYREDGLYDSNGNFYGIALNDISGCYFATNGIDNITVPSDFNNNLYNYYDFVGTCDYFSVTGVVNPAEVLLNNSEPSRITSAYRSNFDTLLNYPWMDALDIGSRDSCIFPQYLEPTSQYADYLTHPLLYDYSATYYAYPLYGENYYVSTSTTIFDNFVTRYGLRHSGDVLLVNRDFVSNNIDGRNISCYVYVGADQAGGHILTDSECISYNLTNGDVGSYPNAGNIILTFGFRSGQFVTPLLSSFTIYRDSSIKTLMYSGDYVPLGYVSDSFNNYNTSNNNSSSVNSSIDNSISLNGQIFNQCQQDFSNYIDNGYVDSSSQANNTTTVINNYYDNNGGSGNGGSDNGTSDNGGTGGSQIIDRLLEALLGFFDSLGKVLATVLTGIIDMFTTVLDALAEIIEDSNTFGEVMAALFGWIPDPVPQVLAAGISLCIIAAVIKFIRG